METTTKKVIRQSKLRELANVEKNIKEFTRMLNDLYKKRRHLNYQLKYEFEQGWILEKGLLNIKLTSNKKKKNYCVEVVSK